LSLQLSDNENADVGFTLRSFREGDTVRARIISVDIEKRRVSFSLKPSYFAEDGTKEQPDAEISDLEAFGPVDEAEEPPENSASEDDGAISASDEDDDDGSIQIDMNEISHALNPHTDGPEIRSPASAPTLKLQGGFQWSGNAEQSDAEAESEPSSDEEIEPSKKKKRRRKEIEHDFTADMHTKTPESNADFERLLLGSPNSSYLWIQYMSFQLQLSEVEKAREIGRRALKTINFREEVEKLNVWIALLNLENVYGTEDSLETTFKDAARHNDSKTVHLRLAFIFDQAEKYEVRI
jgi:rRNA biogenesis protein RRP5